MPGNPKECREHAKHCLELARGAPSALGKARFEDLAQSWVRLANDLERAQALLDHWGSAELKKKTG